MIKWSPMKKLTYSLFVFLVFVTVQINVKAQSFNKEQVAEIQKITHNYIVNNPTVLLEASKKLHEHQVSQEKSQIEKIKKNIVKYSKEIFDASGRVIVGNPNGKVMIAEFTQYQCPHCIDMAPRVDKLLEGNPDVELIIIYWPFFGKDAIFASKAALAMQKQNKFKEFHAAMISAQGRLTKDKTSAIIRSIAGVDLKKLYADIESNKFDSALNNNFKLAQKLGIDGTPAIIFANKELTKFDLIAGQTQDIENDLRRALNSVR